MSINMYINSIFEAVFLKLRRAKLCFLGFSKNQLFFLYFTYMKALPQKRSKQHGGHTAMCRFTFVEE